MLLYILITATAYLIYWIIYLMCSEVFKMCIRDRYETAQIEVQKPFAQEEELKAKTKRQIEVEKLISSGENEPEQNAISDYYYFSATDEQINALNNASIPFEKQTKACLLYTST